MSAQSNAVTPLTAVAPVGADGRRRAAASSQAAGDLDGARRPTATARSPATRSRPTSARRRRRPCQAGASATSATVTGLTNGDGLHVQGHRDQRASGTSPASAASNAVTPQATIFDFATPATVDSGDTELGRARRQVQGRLQRHDHRHPLLQGVDEHRHAHRQPVDVHRHAPGAGDVHQRDASGWQTVTFASPVSVTAGTTYVASYFAPSGHYSVTSSGLATAVDNPPLHALADSTSANGVYAYSATSTFPSSTLQRRQLLGRRHCTPSRRPGRSPARPRSTAGQHSADVSWTAPASGGPVTSYTITPYIGSTAQTPTTVTGSPPATTQDDHRADHRHDLHVHRRRRSTPTAPARRRRSPTP